ncbi:bifunctional 2',3'-cyclic-nucleotide 2'-phosphodiesterase/3'-nucleotidase [Paenibacillus planticolens]|uniref:Bifunctional 2',3'-cyclic-nucleotide 2'-phosphodiesterase/3'-nucleotidase n=1 Tax=Paenibacillus planticolens TaxID=2654976 RepID=A0ABX1ZK15_9BACL|nr:bifunctional 2',3'-cyclic-nucleotide 2'-phosphodiesterase/3'-nucleotidase [Paenibacillus planticolens]NOU99812.1 bifunctional 2',3'-cyclic-nucleotide 2'-phosphodiesterase/3'-nucleotidase [Paenibacillus planticolens]
MTLASADEAKGTELKLRIMETTDIHANIVNYDYYKDSSTDEFGLVKTATLINKYRKEAKNSLLFDNGDLLQGNPLGDLMAKIKPLKDGETHPVYKAMNLLNYDAGNIGNHEFNYGLDFLQRSLKGAKFPYVNSNVYIDDQSGKNYFTPYLLLDRTFVDEKGQEQKLKVGVIGFVPPQVTQWDKANLEGKVIAKDIIESANKFVPKMKEEGADIIVAIAHTGFGTVEATGGEENAAYLLSKVPGIDSILFGHAHVVFPADKFAGPTGVDLAKAGVDMKKGTINGVAAVEPGFWGDNLGVIDLSLQKVDGKWKVADSQSSVIPIYDKANKKPLVEADQSVLNSVKNEHEATLDYVRGPVGTSTAPINSYFALIQDDPSIQLVTNAQKWYVEEHIQGTELDGIPVLSAGAPFKAGGRGGVSYYTDIPAGNLAVKNMADLYVYPNTLNAVLVTGEQLKNWLEMSAGQFNQIDPNKEGEQPLVNLNFPTYNFDVIDGVTYQIDVTQPAKYDTGGKLKNADASRIQNLSYNGKPVDPKQKFIVATNNYRASGGGNFDGANGKTIVISSPDENRQIVIDYIRDHGTVNPSADNNWSLAPINGKATVTFESSPKAIPFAEQLGNLTYLSTDKESGFAKFAMKTEKAAEPAKDSVKPEPAQSTDAPAAPAPAQPAPAPATNATASDEIYIVKSGDVLSRIAKSYGMDWRELAAYNNLKNPHLIYIGQQIRIPAKK